MANAELGDGYAGVMFYNDYVNSGPKYRKFEIYTGNTCEDTIYLTMKEARDLLKFLQIHVDQED